MGVEWYSGSISRLVCVRSIKGGTSMLIVLCGRMAEWYLKAANDVVVVVVVLSAAWSGVVMR